MSDSQNIFNVLHLKFKFETSQLLQMIWGFFDIHYQQYIFRLPARLDHKTELSTAMNSVVGSYIFVTFAGW